MAYYFAVETTENSFEGVNIKKTETYKKLFPESTKPYECTLEEIDKFTTEYRNEKLLRDDLYFNKAISWFYYNRSISIIYVNGIEVRKVTGEMLFADCKKYIDNPNLAIEYITNKIEENDSMFFRNLSLILSETSIITLLISKLATAMEEKKEYEQKTINDKLKNPLQKQVDSNFESDVVKSLFEDCYIDGEGKLIFSDSINYEKFHNIVAFIYSHERELAKNNQYIRTKKPQ